MKRQMTTFPTFKKAGSKIAQVARAAMAGKVKLFAARGQEQERRPLVSGGALAGGLALGGLGLGAGAALVAAPQIKRVAQGVRRAARSVSSAAAQAQATGTNVRNATSIGADAGKMYRWAKSAVGGGVYNLLHPVRTFREVRGAFKAGLAGQKTFPKAKRPGWALARRWHGIRGLKEFAVNRQHWQGANRPLQTNEGGIPFSGVTVKDRYIKQVRDQDLDRRDGNIARAAAAGAIAGPLLLTKRGTISARAALGALGGAAAVVGVRRATEKSKDVYGERSRGAKQAEVAPAVAGLGLAGVLAAKRMKLFSVGGFLRGALAKVRGAGKDVAAGAKMGWKTPKWAALAGGGAAAWGVGAGISKFGARKEFAAKKERKGMNPYVMAGLSGAASGAILGAAPVLRYGTKLGTLAKSIGGSAAASGAIVGGGAYAGSKIIGDPKPDEGAAFTKRAAIGGTLVGAGVGLAGGVALKRIPGASKAIADAAKEWRPAGWLHRAGTVKAGVLGAGLGGAYGLYQGADEGQQVDSIRNLRKDMKKSLSRRVQRIKEFGKANQPRIEDIYTDETGQTRHGHEHRRFASWMKSSVMNQKLVSKRPDGSFEPTDFRAGQVVKSAYNEGKGIQKWARRVGGLAKDSVAVVRGKPRDRDGSGRPRAREWEKSWFKNAVGAAIGGAGVIGAVHVAKHTPFGRKHIRPIWQKAYRVAEEHGFSARLRQKLKEFDEQAAERGWDVRDARGKSARVFAPGSRRRGRRDKEWYERAENERKLWGAGVVAAGTLGVGGALVLGRKPIIAAYHKHLGGLSKRAKERRAWARGNPNAKVVDLAG